MSDNKPTPDFGRASITKNNVYFAETDSLAGVMAQVIGGNKGVNRMYARRIKACVNACAGIPTDMLEAMPSGPASLLPMYARLEKQRDELLAALEGMEKWASSIHDGYPPSTASIAAAPYREAARAAIVRAAAEIGKEMGYPEYRVE